MKSILYLSVLVSFIVLSIFSTDTYAQRRSVLSGNWNDPATWESGIIPGTGDDVTITPSTNVLVNITSFKVNNVYILKNGMITVLKNDGIPRIMSFNNLYIETEGLMQMDETPSISGGFAETAHRLYITGNILRYATTAGVGRLKMYAGTSEFIKTYFIGPNTSYIGGGLAGKFPATNFLSNAMGALVIDKTTATASLVMLEPMSISGNTGDNGIDVVRGVMECDWHQLSMGVTDLVLNRDFYTSFLPSKTYNALNRTAL